MVRQGPVNLTIHGLVAIHTLANVLRKIVGYSEDTNPECYQRLAYVVALGTLRNLPRECGRVTHLAARRGGPSLVWGWSHHLIPLP